ncbi:unnamed protein product [Sphagnum jensenii]
MTSRATAVLRSSSVPTQRPVGELSACCTVFYFAARANSFAGVLEYEDDSRNPVGASGAGGELNTAAQYEGTYPVRTSNSNSTRVQPSQPASSQSLISPPPSFLPSDALVPSCADRNPVLPTHYSTIQSPV